MDKNVWYNLGLVSNKKVLIHRIQTKDSIFGVVFFKPLLKVFLLRIRFKFLNKIKNFQNLTCDYGFSALPHMAFCIFCPQAVDAEPKRIKCQLYHETAANLLSLAPFISTFSVERGAKILPERAHFAHLSGEVRTDQGLWPFSWKIFQDPANNVRAIKCQKVRLLCLERWREM